MSQTKPPVTIDHAPQDAKPNTSSKEQSRSHYIKDSGSRVISIAQAHGLDARLQSEKPEKNALERALIRERKKREQRQKNLEQILKLAHDACKNETAGDPDQDWLTRFFDMAQDVHNPSMQRLWAQVLKREITNPGSTSMKALKVLLDMTPKEAQILQRAAALACSFGSDTNRKLITGIRANKGLFSFGKRTTTDNINTGSYQLPYSSLLILFELGLMHNTELESGEIELSSPLPLSYQGKDVSLQAQSKGVSILYYRFTPTGNELCKLLGNKHNTSYYDQLIALCSQKFTVHADSSTNSIDEKV